MASTILKELDYKTYYEDTDSCFVPIKKISRPENVC